MMKEVGTGRITRNEDVDSLVLDWGVVRVLSEENVTGSVKQSFVAVEVNVGYGHERHNHPGTEEIIYIVSGQAEQMIDDLPPVPVGAGDCIYIPPDVYHSTHNTGGETLHMLVVYAPAGAEQVVRAIPGVKIVPPKGRVA